MALNSTLFRGKRQITLDQPGDKGHDFMISGDFNFLIVIISTMAASLYIEYRYILISRHPT